MECALALVFKNLQHFINASQCAAETHGFAMHGVAECCAARSITG